MRAVAILILLLVLALAVFLVAQPGALRLFSSRVKREDDARQLQRASAQGPEDLRSQAKTNSPAGPSEGFYVGKGGERVYINYATSDPVLRSFLQSVMDGSSDPNAKGKE